jgi:hypothetical protein
MECSDLLHANGFWLRVKKGTAPSVSQEPFLNNKTIEDICYKARSR